MITQVIKFEKIKSSQSLIDKNSNSIAFVIDQK